MGLCSSFFFSRKYTSCVILKLLDLQFYEDLVDGKGSDGKPKSIPDKPLNKKIKFADSDSSDDEEEDHSGEVTDDTNNADKGETTPSEHQKEVSDTPVVPSKDNEEQTDNADESKLKKQRVQDPPISEQTEPKEPTDKPTESTDKPKGSNDKPIDDLIDEDLKELGDRKKVCLKLLAFCTPFFPLSLKCLFLF